MIGQGSIHEALSPDRVREILEQGLDLADLDNKRVLVLTPDSTRTCPLPLMIREITRLVKPRAAQLDYRIALGTHQPMAREEIQELYGVDPADPLFQDVGLLNHRWDLPGTLVTIGRIRGAEIKEISGGLFDQGVDVAINKAALEYDRILILGPVFPHEVAGFSGGNKYLFPGISGGELLHYTHWLGAMITCWDTIGIPDTPVRRAINKAAELVPTPRQCISLVVKSTTELAGLYVGQTHESWTAATELSRQLHVVYKDKPYHTVLGRASTMYNEIWVAGKVMYKLEPVVADGGKLIIYGKHIDRVSDTWGRDIARVGYHVRDYFAKQMERFTGVPLGVLAHSTHVRGLGSFENGVEKPRIEVILATSIPKEECERINLGWMDPDAIDVDDYKGKEDQGVLYVERAGEILHRLRD